MEFSLEFLFEVGHYLNKLDIGSAWSVGRGFSYFMNFSWFRIEDSIWYQEYGQEEVFQDSFIFQLPHLAATFPILVGNCYYEKQSWRSKILLATLVLQWRLLQLYLKVQTLQLTNCTEFIMCVCLDGLRYLKSIVETILIHQHFKKLTPEQHTAKQELVDFWMDFLVEATKTDVTVVRFPVSGCFVGFWRLFLVVFLGDGFFKNKL